PAHDRRGGVRRELEASLGVEAVDRLEQADRRHLDEVVERLAAAAEAPGQVLGQPEMGADELFAQRGVAGTAVLLELAAELVSVRRIERRHRLVRRVSFEQAEAR